VGGTGIQFKTEFINSLGMFKANNEVKGIAFAFNFNLISILNFFIKWWLLVLLALALLPAIPVIIPLIVFKKYGAVLLVLYIMPYD
jgi:hypothetical protein